MVLQFVLDLETDRHIYTDSGHEGATTCKESHCKRSVHMENETDSKLSFRHKLNIFTIHIQSSISSNNTA